MPIYDYQCQPHGHRFEVRHGIHENPVTTCPECGGPVRRIIHPVGIVFKGSGFYATDSRRSSSTSPASEGSTSAASTSEKGGESKPAASDAKTETKSESGSTT